MGEHDVERIEGEELVCACGRRFPSKAAHDGHFGVEMARSALKEART